MGILSPLFGLPSEKTHAAAMNALMAKHLLSQMTEERQQVIWERVRLILLQDGHLTPEEVVSGLDYIEGGKEKALFGLVALAMLELGIAPPRNVWRWVRVRNPLVALINADTEIEMARISLEKRQGIKVSLT